MLHKRFAGACDHASWVFDGLVRAMRRAGSGPTASTRTQMAARGAVSRSSSRTPDRANAPSHRTRRCVLPLPWHKTAPVSLHDEAACGATDDLETCVFRRGKRAFMRDASGFFPAMIGKKSRSADGRVIGDRSCKRSGRCREDRSRDMRSASAHARAARIDTFNGAAHACGMSIACDGFPCAWAATIAHGGGESDRDECRRPGTMRVHASALRDAHRAHGADATRVARWIPIGAASYQTGRSLQIRDRETRRSASRRYVAAARSYGRCARAARRGIGWPAMLPCCRRRVRGHAWRRRATTRAERQRARPRAFPGRSLNRTGGPIVCMRSESSGGVSRMSLPSRRRLANIVRSCRRTHVPVDADTACASYGGVRQRHRHRRRPDAQPGATGEADRIRDGRRAARRRAGE